MLHTCLGLQRRKELNNSPQSFCSASKLEQVLGLSPTTCGSAVFTARVAVEYSSDLEGIK